MPLRSPLTRAGSLFVGALMVAGPLRAQVPERLTLVDAVRRAGTVAPAALAASGSHATIVGRARTDAQWTNPMLEIRRENEGAPIPYDDFATITVPVSFTGRRLALGGALAAARERALADSLGVIRAAEYGAARAWWEAWVAEQGVALASAQAARVAEIARHDSLRAAEGVVAEATALRTRIEAERARYVEAQARSAAAYARAALAAAVGIDDASAVALDSAGASRLAPLPDEDPTIAEALRRRPDVRVAEAAVREADRRRAAERRAAFPDVGLTGGYKGTGGYATGQFGLVLYPPLLNLNGGNRERSDGEWRLAEAERRATELRATNEVRAALVAARALDAGARGLDAAFAARADTVALAAEASYREGAATLTELLEALRARVEARAVGIRAVADRALARLDLRRALGAPPVEE